MGIQIQAAIKRGFLRQIAEGAKRTAMTLREALLSAQGNIYSPSFQKGRIVVSQSGSGQSGSFEIGIVGKEFTQEKVFGMLEEFIELLEDTITDEIPDDGQPESVDNLLAAMFQTQELQEITEQMGDFSCLNFPATSQ